MTSLDGTAGIAQVASALAVEWRALATAPCKAAEIQTATQERSQTKLLQASLHGLIVSHVANFYSLKLKS